MSTIKDVAEQAGCSIATVSRVLNGTAPIAVETRGRVAGAISALGYRALRGWQEPKAPDY